MKRLIKVASDFPMDYLAILGFLALGIYLNKYNLNPDAMGLGLSVAQLAALLMILERTKNW